MAKFWIWAGLVCVGFLLFSGCDAGPNMAKVHGRVTVDGKPLTAGSVQFSPMGSLDNPNPGKSATGAVQEDGTFVLGTNSKKDGAVVGMHRVSVRNKSKDPSIPAFDFLQLFGQTFEVVAGEKNEINLEITSEQIKKYAEDD